MFAATRVLMDTRNSTAIQKLATYHQGDNLSIEKHWGCHDARLEKDAHRKATSKS